jgi:hypothetical protein
MVRIHPDPPGTGIGDLRSRGSARSHRGAVAQLGERLLCKQEVVGSIPSSSTSFRHRGSGIGRRCAVRKATPRDQTQAAGTLLPSGVFGQSNRLLFNNLGRQGIRGA